MADKQQFKHETRGTRWVKYGGNVVLSSVIVVAIAVLLTYAATANSIRKDMTAAGTYSLKPQTKAVLDGLKQKVKIVSLYWRPTADEIARNQSRADQAYRADAVADLLEEYSRLSDQIEIDAFDPVMNQAKADALVQEVVGRFNNEVQQYKSVVDQFNAALGPIREQLTAHAAADQGVTGGDQQALLIRSAAQEELNKLDDAKKRITELVSDRVPDYQGAANRAREAMTTLSSNATAISEQIKPLGNDPRLTPGMKQVIDQAIPLYEQVKKQADDAVAKFTMPGSSKVEAMRRSLGERNAILIIGENDTRVLPENAVWNLEQEWRNYTLDKTVRPQFAGEQQITGAILSLQQEKKQKVAIVRPGGPPVATLQMFQRGFLSVVSQRLRDYNFEILEKDLTGQWRQQAMMRGMMAEPEPTDEEIRDALWVVVLPAAPTGNPTSIPTIGEKVAEHLKNGGSALILSSLESERLNALKDWGIEQQSDKVIVHDLIPTGGAETGDWLDQVLRIQLVFSLSAYGDHPLTKPINGLSSLLVAPVVVKTTTPAEGYTVTPLLPAVSSAPVWGESNSQLLFSERTAKFDAGVDMQAPLFAGAASESKNGNRVVALGILDSLGDRWTGMPDPQLLESNGVVISRFPANTELFVNSVLWLAKMEQMLAISPSAMQVSRISDMSPATRNFWHYGVLIVGLPALVLVAGVVTFVNRRS